jgi:hypothetical protein
MTRNLLQVFVRIVVGQELGHAIPWIIQSVPTENTKLSPKTLFIKLSFVFLISKNTIQNHIPEKEFTVFLVYKE